MNEFENQTEHQHAVAALALSLVDLIDQGTAEGHYAYGLSGDLADLRLVCEVKGRKLAPVAVEPEPDPEP